MIWSQSVSPPLGWTLETDALEHCRRRGEYRTPSFDRIAWWRKDNKLVRALYPLAREGGVGVPHSQLSIRNILVVSSAGND